MDVLRRLEGAMRGLRRGRGAGLDEAATLARGLRALRGRLSAGEVDLVQGEIATLRAGGRGTGLAARFAQALRPGGKRRFDPAQVVKGIKEELEHAATIKKIQRNPQLSVKQAAELIAKDHLRKHGAHAYDRMQALKIPKRGKGLKSPRIELLHRVGKLKVYLVASHLVRQMKGQGDWANGGHNRVFPETCPPCEVWVGDETFGPERKCYLLHELLEFWRMGNGMGYDQAHDLSTAAEQKYRRAGMKGIDAAVRGALRKAAASC